MDKLFINYPRLGLWQCVDEVCHAVVCPFSLITEWTRQETSVLVGAEYARSSLDIGIISFL
jgi:hypothetical protein